MTHLANYFIVQAAEASAIRLYQPMVVFCRFLGCIVKAMLDPERAVERLETDPEFANLERLKDDNGITSNIRAKIYHLGSEAARLLGLSELSYGSDHWIGFTDVLLRGLRNFHSSGKGQPQDFRQRYSTWRGFAPIDPQFEPEMEHEFRKSAYLEKLIQFLNLILTTYGLQFYVSSSGQIGAVHPALNVQVSDMVFVLFGGNTLVIHPSFSGKGENITVSWAHVINMN